MCLTTGTDMTFMGWGMENVQGLVSGFSGVGVSAICGTLASLVTSETAMAVGTLPEPKIRSTLSCSTNLRACLTANVASVASSSMTISTFRPPSVSGMMANVLLYGMPNEAPGPVSPTIRPTLMVSWATAAEMGMTAASAKAKRLFFICMSPAVVKN